jgi:hypothetical protein
MVAVICDGLTLTENDGKIKIMFLKEEKIVPVVP